MEELLEYRQRLLERYADSVDELALLLSRFPAERRDTLLDQNDHTLIQVVTHLRDTEAQIFLPRLERILLEDPSQPGDLAQGVLSERTARIGGLLGDVLKDYARLRSRELALLRDIPEKAWSREARHPVWGMRTLQWWVEHSLAHAGEHIRKLKFR